MIHPGKGDPLRKWPPLKIWFLRFYCDFFQKSGCWVKLRWPVTQQAPRGVDTRAPAVPNRAFRAGITPAILYWWIRPFKKARDYMFNFGTICGKSTWRFCIIFCSCEKWDALLSREQKIIQNRQVRFYTDCSKVEKYFGIVICHMLYTIWL